MKANLKIRYIKNESYQIYIYFYKALYYIDENNINTRKYKCKINNNNYKKYNSKL